LFNPDSTRTEAVPAAREDTVAGAHNWRIRLTAVFAVRLAAFVARNQDAARQQDELIAQGQGLDEIWQRAANRGEVDLNTLTPRLRSLPFDLVAPSSPARTRLCPASRSRRSSTPSSCPSSSAESSNRDHRAWQEIAC
jgi:hypothetical protein